MTYAEAFEKFIKGKTIAGPTYIYYGYEDYNGIVTDDGYAAVATGGSCAGNIIQTVAIFDPEGKLIVNVEQA